MRAAEMDRKRVSGRGVARKAGGKGSSVPVEAVATAVDGSDYGLEGGRSASSIVGPYCMCSTRHYCSLLFLGELSRRTAFEGGQTMGRRNGWACSTRLTGRGEHGC